ncbi:MAG: potassium-transporting ATPase subunit KdpA [Chlamydiales bacterium]|nr:potassium-transporting ATPase subunit KdpA [Chlamydiales bacterium]
MRELDWFKLALFMAILTAITKPLGIYMSQVLNPTGKTFLDSFFKPLENLTYRICGINKDKEQTWKEYLLGVVVFSLVSFIVTFFILAAQPVLPLNPANLGTISLDLNFNTSMSFMTNTNWQSYSGESTMSYFSQMVALTLQNFVSAAVGVAVAASLTRGIVRQTCSVIGNFWVDLVRISFYLLLPLSIILSVFFISQGVPQNFKSYVHATTMEGDTQVIVQGPIASQEAIKILGTNGGGYTNANSSHPYENPTPLSNFIQILAILAIPAAQLYYFGRELKYKAHGWSIYTAMAILFVMGVIICSTCERKGNHNIIKDGVEFTIGNMEGKEQRFGVFDSTLFAASTTAASNGAVNSMHDSYTPIGGLIPMLNIQLGEIVWGGVGAGLYSIFIFIILAIFTAGLIIGRTPEYLGNKITGLDVKLSIFTILPFILSILGFTAIACVSKWGVGALGNTGPHGLSEILYAYSSTTGNNGSAFAGLSVNTPIWNITLGLAMLVGRFCMIIPVIALAGSFAGKKKSPITSSSFPIAGVTFTLLLMGIIILIGALSFLPALVMGPIMEQFFMNNLTLF